MCRLTMGSSHLGEPTTKRGSGADVFISVRLSCPASFRSFCLFDGVPMVLVTVSSPIVMMAVSWNGRFGSRDEGTPPTSAPDKRAGGAIDGIYGSVSPGDVLSSKSRGGRAWPEGGNSWPRFPCLLGGSEPESISSEMLARLGAGLDSPSSSLSEPSADPDSWLFSMR